MHPRTAGLYALVRCTWDIHLLVSDAFEPKDTPLDVRNAIIRRLRGPVAELYIQDQINLLVVFE